MPSTLGITFNRSKKKWHWKKLHNHNEHNYISINFFLTSNIISHHRTKRTSHTLEGYRINFQYLFKVHKFKLNKYFIWFFFFIHHNLSSVFDCEVNSPNVWCHILFILIIIESWSNFTNFFSSTCAFIINKIFKSVYSYSFCMFYNLLRISEWKKNHSWLWSRFRNLQKMILWRWTTIIEALSVSSVCTLTRTNRS